MLSSVLMGLSAAVILLLGTVHLLYTFRGPKLLPRDAQLQSKMEAVSPVISDETTMWRAWVGFNASHSLGAMLFGLVYGYLAWAHPSFLIDSLFLSSIGFAMLAALLFLGRRYWFSIPFTGIGISLLCYVAGQVLARI